MIHTVFKLSFFQWNVCRIWTVHQEYLYVHNLLWQHHFKGRTVFYTWIHSNLLSHTLCGAFLVARLCQLFATPKTVTRSRGFSREEDWSGFSCPPPEDLPNPGIEPRSPALQVDFFTIWATREAPITVYCLVFRLFPIFYFLKNAW